MGPGCFMNRCWPIAWERFAAVDLSEPGSHFLYFVDCAIWGRLPQYSHVGTTLGAEVSLTMRLTFVAVQAINC